MAAMRVLVADDHPLYREAVRLRLERLLADCTVVEAGSLDQVLAVTRTVPVRSFDLILLDIHLSDTDPEGAVQSVIEAAPDTPLLLMSGSASPKIVKQAIARGARGFVPKTMASDLFATAISMVLGGGSYLPIEILQDAADTPAPAASPREQRFEDILTDRERQVLVLVATGASNKEIGRELGLAEVTVKLHVRQILRKIGARNRSEAASIATRSALI